MPQLSSFERLLHAFSCCRSSYQAKLVQVAAGVCLVCVSWTMWRMALPSAAY